MQGLESLSQFKKFVSSLGGLGRFEDTYMVHAAEGETVVPMEVLDRNPVLKKRLFKSMKALGIDPGRYIVGNDLNSLNPVTGQPEFFFKKIFKRLKKAAGDISGYAAPIVGAMYGPAAGALVGAGLGAFKRENPGDPSQWAQMGMLGGGSGIAANILGGQNPFMGRGLGETYGYNPKNIFSGVMDRPMDFLKTDDEYNIANYFKDAFGLSGEDKETISSSNKTVKALLASDPNPSNPSDETLNAIKNVLSSTSKKTKVNPFKLATLFGIGTLGLGALIDYTSDDVDVGPEPQTLPIGVPHQGILNPQLTYANPNYREGGILDLQGGGESRGPGTGTSDSIPAMLSDGEFVMTADAVRGAGGGNRREGARRMYEAMDRLEARA